MRARLRPLASSCLLALLLAGDRSAAASGPGDAFRSLGAADLAQVEICVAPSAGARGAAQGPRECLVLYAADPSAPPRPTDSLRSVAILGASLKVIWPVRITGSRLRSLVDSVLAVPGVGSGSSAPNPAVSVMLLRSAADSVHTVRAFLDVGSGRLLFSRMRAALSSDPGAVRTLQRLACEWGLVPLTSVDDVSGSVSVESAVLRRENTGIVDVKVRVINKSDEYIPGPLALVLGEESSRFLIDPDGFTCTARPAGRAYVTISGRNGLAPWNAAGLVLRFKNPPPGALELGARVFSGLAP